MTVLEAQREGSFVRGTITRAGLERVAMQALPIVLVLCAFLFAASLVTNIRIGLWGFDFEGTLWRAGRDILAGVSPYPPADPGVLLHPGHPVVYPAPMLLAAVPLSLLPLAVAVALWNAVNVGALVLALRLVGVRDLRCYALVLLSFPLASSLVLGQLDGVLALGCALAWRYRASARIVVPAVAGVIAAKLFLWPLLLWLAITRGIRWALAAAGVAAATIVCGWAVLGFDGFLAYPRLLWALGAAFQDRGHSLVAAALALGVPLGTARALPWLAGAVLIGLSVALAGRAGGESRSFAAAVGAGIFLSPVVWMHYFLLLVLVLAIRRPRPDLAWLLVPLFWVSATEPAVDVWRLLAGVSCALLMLGLAVARPRVAAARPLPALT